MSPSRDRAAAYHRTMNTSAISACLLLCAALAASGADLQSSVHKGSVTVSLTVENVVGDHAQLVANFKPDQEAQPLHLYSKDLVGDLGMPTRLELKADGAVRAAGPVIADQQPHALADEPTVMVYPDGPVTLRLPIILPAAGDGAAVPTTVLVGYMACSASACKMPVKTQLTVAVPTAAARDGEKPGK